MEQQVTSNYSAVNVNDRDEYRRLATTETGCSRLFEMLDTKTLPKSVPY